MQHLRASIGSIVCALLVLACGRQATEEGEVDSAEQASSAVESSGDVAYVNGYFAAEATLQGMTEGEAAAQALAQVSASVQADLTVPECATIDSDGATYVEITFVDCTGAAGRVALDGSIRGELSFETAPCGGGQCPTAVIYDVTTSGLTIGGAAISGAWQVRDPIAGTAATTWSGEMTISGSGRTVTSSSSAEWTIEGDCVTYSLDAQVTGGVRGLSIEAHDVTRCVGSCPLSGSVTLTTQAGASLSWSYDGTGSAIVTTGAGGELEVTLACDRS